MAAAAAENGDAMMIQPHVKAGKAPGQPGQNGQGGALSCLPPVPHHGRWAHGARPARLLVMAGLASLLLAGCAGLGGPAPGAAVTPPSAEALAAEAQARQLAGFVARQRQLAEDAEARGEWARAAWAWEALQALRPEEPAAAARLLRARQAADSLSTLRVQQARLALQLNDLDSARDLFLRALVAQPEQPDAIEGLRALERERVRQQMQAQAARVAPARQGRPVRAELEHASLLAMQGELDGAIALLLPLAQARPSDASARRSLSDLYLQQAEAQYPVEPAKALATLQLSLQMDSRNVRASTLQREWRKSLAPSARGGAGPGASQGAGARPAAPAGQK